jgi:ABC-type glycerol-3-phosphate transport system substrate-binding protein
MDTPAWKAFPADVLTKKLVDSVGQERALDYNKFFADYLENTVPMWTSPVEDFASDTLDATIDEVLHKTKTPEQALQEAQKLISSKLEDALKGS